ncbi:MAG: histidine kinase N-terminal 7TM domain-containing protein [Bacillota bacterium]|nr:histidine kinase N-terminal 7TM domain-containing protein [Bacillota bacterium]MDW7678240.1 histidine kinase N-terminal 7TM domain-containing protein [Bacillota bacterium]
MQEIVFDLGLLFISLSLVLITYTGVMVLRMKRKNQVHYAFLWLMGTISIWALGAAFMHYDYLQGRPVNPQMLQLSYIGLILAPVAILFLGVTFAKTKIPLSWKQALFLLIPLVSMIMLFTNDQHHLFYRYLLYEELTVFEALGSYFIVHTLYSYICIAVGMWYLLTFSVKNAGFFSRQSILILLGILISTGYNGLLTFQVINGLFHTNALFFIVTLAFFYFAIFKYDFLNVVPVALQKIVDHISDGFMVLGKDGFIIDYNLTFQKIFEPVMQIRRKHDLAELATEINDNPEVSELLSQFALSVQSEANLSYEKSIRIGSDLKHFSIEITPIYNNQGVYLSTIVLLKDITQVKEALNTIQRNYEILAEQERLASLGQLIGGIAHNLKTPIMSISGVIEGLTDLIDEYRQSVSDPMVTVEDHHEIAEEMQVWIEKIRPHCTYMSDIISTVKGQAAQFSTETHMRFALDELIKRVDLLMKHELRRYHCELQIHFETDHFIEIRGEVNSLVQIFDNLIMNAIQSYDGKRGLVDLSIRLEGDEVLFILRDYGKGIPVDTQKKLFREMVTTKGKQGTGLGLYMSHATIKGRFGGKLWFESTPGEGTTFFISIPVAHAYQNVPQETANLPIDKAI